MEEKIKVIFVFEDGSEKIVEANIGESVLQVAHSNQIPLEGACEGSLACSTCHVIVDPAWFDKYEMDAKSEDEEDMLDLACGLERTSRLGCQIILRKEFDGIRLKIPAETRNYMPK